MAKTADRKLEVAHKLYQLAVNDQGLTAENLIFDPLTFTLATVSWHLVEKPVLRLKKRFTWNAWEASVTT